MIKRRYIKRPPIIYSEEQHPNPSPHPDLLPLHPTSLTPPPNPTPPLPPNNMFVDAISSLGSNSRERPALETTHGIPQTGDL